MSKPQLNKLLQWSIQNSAGCRELKDPDSQTPSSNGTTTNTDTANGPTPPGLDASTISALFDGPSEADLMIHYIAQIEAPFPNSTIDSSSSTTDTTNATNSADATTNITTSLATKISAFEALEALIADLDHANNMKPLGLWEPLLAQLDRFEETEEAEMAEARMECMTWAAWCVGTAVQNNARCQAEVLQRGGMGKLVAMVVGGGADSDAGAGAGAGASNGVTKQQREGEEVAENEQGESESESESEKEKAMERERKEKGLKKKVVYALSSIVRNHQPAADELVKLLPVHLVRGEDGGRVDMDATDMDEVDAMIDRLRAL